MVSEPVSGQDDPVKVLHEDERHRSRGDRPAGDELDLLRPGRGSFRVVYLGAHFSVGGKVSKPRLSCCTSCWPFHTATRAASIAKSSMLMRKASWVGKSKTCSSPIRSSTPLQIAGPSNTSMQTKPRMAKPALRRWRVRFSWVVITASRTARRVFCESRMLASLSGQAIERAASEGRRSAPPVGVWFIAPLPPLRQLRLRKYEASVQRGRGKASTLPSTVGNALLVRFL